MAKSIWKTMPNIETYLGHQTTIMALNGLHNVGAITDQDYADAMRAIIKAGKIMNITKEMCVF